MAINTGLTNTRTLSLYRRNVSSNWSYLQVAIFEDGWTFEGCDITWMLWTQRSTHRMFYSFTAAAFVITYGGQGGSTAPPPENPTDTSLTQDYLRREQFQQTTSDRYGQAYEDGLNFATMPTSGERHWQIRDPRHMAYGGRLWFSYGTTVNQDVQPDPEWVLGAQASFNLHYRSVEPS